jgi:hypothetical protein
MEEIQGQSGAFNGIDMSKAVQIAALFRKRGRKSSQNYNGSYSTYSRGRCTPKSQAVSNENSCNVKRSRSRNLNVEPPKQT